MRVFRKLLVVLALAVGSTAGSLAQFPTAEFLRPTGYLEALEGEGEVVRLFFHRGKLLHVMKYGALVYVDPETLEVSKEYLPGYGNPGGEKSISVGSVTKSNFGIVINLTDPNATDGRRGVFLDADGSSRLIFSTSDWSTAALSAFVQDYMGRIWIPFDRERERGLFELFLGTTDGTAASSSFVHNALLGTPGARIGAFIHGGADSFGNVYFARRANDPILKLSPMGAIDEIFLNKGFKLFNPTIDYVTAFADGRLVAMSGFGARKGIAGRCLATVGNDLTTISFCPRAFEGSRDYLERIYLLDGPDGITWNLAPTDYGTFNRITSNLSVTYELNPRLQNHKSREYAWLQSTMTDNGEIWSYANVNPYVINTPPEYGLIRVRGQIRPRQYGVRAIRERGRKAQLAFEVYRVGRLDRKARDIIQDALQLAFYSQPEGATLSPDAKFIGHLTMYMSGRDKKKRSSINTSKKLRGQSVFVCVDCIRTTPLAERQKKSVGLAINGTAVGKLRRVR